MLASFGAMLRISVRRSRADWPIVASAGLICVLAATLVAAGAIYSSAVSTAGLRRAIVDAPDEVAGIKVAGWVSPAGADALDTLVAEALAATLGPVSGEIHRFGGSGTFALPDQPADDVRGLALLGSAEGIEARTTLIAGAWLDRAASSGVFIPVAVSDVVADRLQLDIGDRLELESRIDPGTFVTIGVEAIFRIDDPGDPYWGGDAQYLDGLVRSERFDTFGPFFTTGSALRAADLPEIELTWRAIIDPGSVGLGDVPGLQQRVDGLDDRLGRSTKVSLDVSSGLPELLSDTQRSLLVSRTGIVLLSAQLLVLAAYAVLLAASLLVEHRRIDTAMLRSRGAGTTRIVGLAIFEGLLLTVPAAVVAPWLAAILLRGFNVAGPLADIELALDPSVTIDAYVAATVAAAVCLLALTLPAFGGARTYASVRGSLVRADSRGIAQRLGLDFALLSIAAIGLWQLRHYGAPLTRSVRGVLGLDPLLVAVPTLGLLAGAVFALRIVPLLAAFVERATRRRRGLVASLGARQLARRPLRYTRAALMLMLATAIGVFAVSYTGAWADSQRDQATFQVGSDVRVQPSRRSGTPRSWELDQAYAGIDGIGARMPVKRAAASGSGGARNTALLGLDAAVAPSVVAMRSDLGSASMADLMAPLVEARPNVEAIRLPGRPRRLRLAVDVEIRSLVQPFAEPDTGSETAEPLDLDVLAGWLGADMTVVVRDARGLLHRFAGDSAVAVAGGPHEATVALGDPDPGTGISFSYPLDLLAVELSISLPPDHETTDATIVVGSLATDDGDGAWRATSLELPDGWRIIATSADRSAHEIAARRTGPSLVAAAGGAGLPSLGGPGRWPPTRLNFAPTGLGDLDRQPIPIVANDRFLEATASGSGDSATLSLAGVRRSVTISGVVHAFPGTDPDVPVVIVDLDTLSLLGYEGSDSIDPPDEWWFQIEDGTDASVVEALAGSPFDSRSVLSRTGLNRSLATDPVALGIIGGLTIGFVAAALFAIVGFVVSAAVSAQERVNEFALLRALGLSSGQLSVWLSLENAVLASLSLLAGTALGLIIAWVVLPFITVTQGAATPYPPVRVEMPWGPIGWLVATAAVALAATVLALAWLLPRIGLQTVTRMSED